MQKALQDKRYSFLKVILYLTALPIIPDSFLDFPKASKAILVGKGELHSPFSHGWDTIPKCWSVKEQRLAWLVAF